ncbi:penicillin-binding protein 2 [soil metagenome]
MKFSLRLATLGVIFVAMFSVLGLRLWFVQVAEGAALAEVAQELKWDSRSFEAPRGDIYDRMGELLVTSRYVPAVEVDRAFVSSEQREDLVQGLSAVMGVPAAEIDELYEAAGTNGRFTVGVVSTATATALATRLESFPGVEIVKLPERVYLTGPDLAHVTGHLGLPTPDDLEANSDLDPTVRIGQLGVEKTYDEYLRGVPGSWDYRVVRGEVVESRPETPPVSGQSVHLALDLELQEVVSKALTEGIELANEVKAVERAAGEDIYSEAQSAAAVVRDAKSGQVLSLVSLPTFDPNVFVSGIDQATFDQLRDARAFNNLAISGLYPPASTFKAVTYAAAEQYRLPLPDTDVSVDQANRTVHCKGQIVFDLADGSQQVKHDWYTGDKGWLDIHGALEQSCNIYFWSIGLGVYRNRNEINGNVLQDFARDLGYGPATGIDLTAEASGTIPTPELFEEWKEFQLANPNVPPRLEPSRLDLPGGPFLGGDLMDLAIGQGALTATPLQVAVSYAALVNGGEVLKPAVVAEVRDAAGIPVYQHTPTVERTVDIDPSVRASLLTDLGRVVNNGTARAAFVDFGPGVEDIGGKTGTGQTTPNRDNHAWFTGVAPLSDPQYVVVVLIDEGGSGGRVAAPVARHILQYLMGNEPTPIVEGEEAD